MFKYFKIVNKNQINVHSYCLNILSILKFLLLKKYFIPHLVEYHLILFIFLNVSVL